MRSVSSRSHAQANAHRLRRSGTQPGPKPAAATAAAASVALQQLMDERRRRRLYGPAVEVRPSVVGEAADGVAAIVNASIARVGLPRWAIVSIVLLAVCGAAGYAAVAASAGQAAPGAAIAGRVLLNGKPLAQAALEFHATERADTGAAVPLRVETDHEGAFRRAAAVGVPAGTYAVVVRSGCFMPPGAEVGRPVRIPAKYASVASTPLEVRVEGDRSTFDLVLRQ